MDSSGFTYFLPIISTFTFSLLLKIPSNLYAMPAPAVYQTNKDDTAALNIHERLDEFVSADYITEEEKLLLKTENKNESKQWKSQLTAGDIAGYSPFINMRISKEIPLRKGVSRSAHRNLQYLWPGGQVPYQLSEKYTPRIKEVITSAMEEFQNKTCIRFVPHKPHIHKDYIYIEPVNGCYSMVGRVGGAQQLSLGNGCFVHGIIVHELMHAIGFFHEHNRIDRDRYIKILWKNIASGRESEFRKEADQYADILGFPYDYGSIMHYEMTAFSRNGKPIMELVRPSDDNVGQREGLSTLDVQKINKLYRCPQLSTALFSTKLDAKESPHPSFGFCEDLNERCTEWIEMGYCNSPLYQSYMEKVCQKSCGLCYATTAR